MHSFNYKGWTIHVNLDTGVVKIQSPDFTILTVKSVQAGKCRITRAKH